MSISPNSSEFGGELWQRLVGNVTPFGSDTAELSEEKTSIRAHVETVGVSWETERQEEHQVMVVELTATLERRAALATESPGQPIPVLCSLHPHPDVPVGTPIRSSCHQ
jgi:hypothetical protein